MIELLAPGGSKQAIESAVNYGADAVYFGVGSFNARAGADNISAEQLPEIIDFLHSRSAKGYLALNILLRDHELKEALELADHAAAAGVDGVIVQDLGLSALVRTAIPNLPIHASTQMTITDVFGLERAHELGLNRVVLPRELNAQSIKELSSYAHNLGIETEVFVHGALCIAYSGQCLISGIKKGRSANRGQCSQPCRLPYEISEYQRPYKKGSARNLPESYSPLLSPKDQALIDYLPELIAAGVSSLKIEGRMRSADYTAIVVSEYRKAINQVSTGCSIEIDKRNLLLAYNRGGDFTDRYYIGKRDNNFVTGKYPGSYGLHLGTVEKAKPESGELVISLDQGINIMPNKGDVLSVRSGSRETASAPLGFIEVNKNIIMIKAFHPDVLRKIRPGEQVFQMSDNVNLNQIKSSMKQRIPLEFRLETRAVKDATGLGFSEAMNNNQSGYLNMKLSLKIISGALTGLESHTEKLIIAMDSSISENRIKQQLAKTGATQFSAETITYTDLDGSGARISIAELNSLRREALQALEHTMIDSFKLKPASAELPKSAADTKIYIHESKSSQDLEGNKEKKSAADKPRIDVWYQRLPDNPAETACGADCYILPLWSLADSKGKPWIDALKRQEPAARIFSWIPPAPQNEIAKWTAEMLGALEAYGIDGICSGHPGAAKMAGNNLKLQIDSGLNITNRRSAGLAFSNNLDSVMFSAELTAVQIYDLVQGLKSEQFSDTRLTLPIYGRQRLMSIVYCPVGHNIAGCKKCHKQDTVEKPDNARLYDLNDQSNKKLILQTHPLFCTVDIFDNSLMLDLDYLKYSWKMKTAWRLIFLDENHDERIQIVNMFRKLSNKSVKDRFQTDIGLNKLISRTADRIAEGAVDSRRRIYE